MHKGLSLSGTVQCQFGTRDNQVAVSNVVVSCQLINRDAGGLTDAPKGVAPLNRIDCGFGVAWVNALGLDLLLNVAWGVGRPVG